MKAFFFPILTILFIGLLSIAGCTKEGALPPNPFEGIPPIDTTETPMPVDTIELEANSLEWIHARIFAPTCANSGCHDGTFEPNFSTIQSSYNTLVEQAVIKTDSSISINLRVVPFQPENSMLYYRLNEFLPNSSGIMPLESNDSDYDANKSEYIEAIRTWIANGASNI